MNNPIDACSDIINVPVYLYYHEVFYILTSTQFWNKSRVLIKSLRTRNICENISVFISFYSDIVTTLSCDNQYLMFIMLSTICVFVCLFLQDDCFMIMILWYYVSPALSGRTSQSQCWLIRRWKYQGWNVIVVDLIKFLYFKKVIKITNKCLYWIFKSQSMLYIHRTRVRFCLNVHHTPGLMWSSAFSALFTLFHPNCKIWGNPFVPLFTAACRLWNNIRAIERGDATGFTSHL